jgi:dTDP-4-amino-4,6-dideoxygalactose transaminase
MLVTAARRIITTCWRLQHRMEGLQGAILPRRLRHLGAYRSRRAHARLYDELLAEEPRVMRPWAAPYAQHVYHIYAVRSADRTELQRALQNNGVQTGIHYPIPVHLQDGYRDLGYVAGEFPQTERAAREVLSLPMFSELSNMQVEMVSAAVHQNVHAI